MQWVIGQRVYSDLERELGLGTVTEVGGLRTVTVTFASSRLTRIYAQSTAPLQRVVLRAGQRVRLESGEAHTIKTVETVAGLLAYRSERGLRFLEAEILETQNENTPKARFLQGEWDSPKTFELREKALRLRELADHQDLRGLVGSRVELLPHQLFVAQEVSGRAIPRVLLADEVGLGKTIEAGLIFASLRATGRAERVLILVPDALRHQWLAEMHRRFGELFAVVDEARSEAEEDSQGQSALEGNQRVISSLTFLENDSRRRDQALEVDWDLVIIDEAHRLEWTENEPSIGWEIARSLSERTRGLLLLTATPERHGDRTEFGLLKLVDPQRFSDFAEFERSHSQMLRVAQLADKIQNGDRATHVIAKIKKTFGEAADLQPLIEDYAVGGAGEELLRRLVDRHGTGRVFIRNRRNRLGGFPQRKLCPIALTSPEPWAEFLAGEFSDEDLLEIAAGTPDDSLDLTAVNAWFKKRAASLLSLLKQLGEEKILLICYETETVLRLQEFLRTNSAYRSAVFHEEMEIIDRDRQAAWFAEADGARVLICSEVGGEGRNFQFCRHLFLFDLPLSADALEQRIGRLDRIGQQKSFSIHVPYYLDTPEEALVEWYTKGMAICDEPWNGGDLSKSLRREFLRTLRVFVGPQSESRRSVLAKTISHAQEEVQEIRRQQKTSTDILVDLNSFDPLRGKEIREAIASTDRSPELPIFMELALDHFGIESEKIDEKGVYRLSLHSLSFVSHFPGLNSEQDLLATFHREAALIRPELQFLSVEHPIVQGALALILGGDSGKASVVQRPNPAEPAVFEFLFTIQIAFPKHLALGAYLPPHNWSLFVGTEGARLDKFERPDWQHLKAVPLTERKPILEKFKEPLERAEQTAFLHAEARTTDMIRAATEKVTASFERERARLRERQKVNPLITDNDIEFLERNHSEALAALQGARVHLDAFRLII